MKKYSALIGLLFLAACSASGAVSSFEECVEAGNPVMESYPEQCRTEDGELFVRDIGNALAKSDLIRVTTPLPGETLSGTVAIIGEARGYWFFEASFPVTLQDEDGNDVTTVVAQAQDEWMTEKFVPFTAEVEIPADLEGTTGKLILKRDNPSDLPENDDQLYIPVRF